MLMSRIVHLFSFDMKLLRYLYFFPFLTYLLCAILMLAFGARFDSPFTTYNFVQGVAVPIAGWHLVFLYSSLYEEGAKETLIVYYRKVLVLDIVRYIVLHGFFILSLVGLSVWIIGPGFFNKMIVSHLILLFLFFQLVGIALLSAINSLEITLAIIASYTLVEVITQGTFMPWPHLFIFEDFVEPVSLGFTYLFLSVGILASIVQLWWKFK